MFVSKSHRRTLVVGFAAVLFHASPLTAEQYITVEEAAEHPDFAYQGEYLGEVTFADDDEPTRVGIQLAARGDGWFDGFLYHGGLPGDGWYAHQGERHSISAERSDDDVETDAHRGVTFRYQDGELIARDADGETCGTLERVVRSSPTMGKKPPEDAIVLFDGTSVDKWRDGAQIVEDNLLREGARTADDYGDMYLHLEFMPGFMPTAGGHRRNNSGVYIQNRYEVQILDSFGMPDSRGMNAALYNEHAPLLNMSYPPLQWQSFDIYFRAPRFDDDGNKTENMRITVFHNGVLVHDDIELQGGTGAGGRRDEVAEAHTYLQAHTGPVRFRNVWLVEDATVKPRTWEPDTNTLYEHRLGPGESFTLDAMEAQRHGHVSTASNHDGYHGSGFISFNRDDTESSLRWTVNLEEDGRYKLRFRYALASGERPLRVSVNGETVADPLDFPATGAWNQWSTVSTTAELEAGENTIELSQIAIRGSNIDRLELQPVD